jgi:hypothetical protein
LYSKNQEPVAGCPLTVTLVAALNAFASVIECDRYAMIGMPTPTCVPSLICSETCTGVVATGGADELLGAEALLDALEEPAGVLFWPAVPLPLLFDEQAEATSTVAAKIDTRPAARRIRGDTKSEVTR